MWTGARARARWRAPQHYKVSIENGAKSLTINEADAARSTRGSQLPIRVPLRAALVDTAESCASFTFVYCREDNTGTCRIKTLVWRAPVEVVSDNAAASEIKFAGKVSGDRGGKTQVFVAIVFLRCSWVPQLALARH